MNSETAADDPPPANSAAANQSLPADDVPPNHSEYTVAHPGSSRCLIRRVPSDGYDFKEGVFRISAFIPAKRDDKGLSVNWEGSEPEFETAHTLLAKALGQKLRECGGVIAVTFEAVHAAGFQIERSDSETSRWHSLIPQLTYPIYDAKTRNEFIEYADKLLRAANQQPTRIAPKPLPKS